MDQLDLRPVKSPTLDQQRDALQKGLGRAAHWAESQMLADGPLLGACLKEQCYDTQLEGSRVNWLWWIIEAAESVDRFREPILRAFERMDDERSQGQLIGLALCYAKMGDAAFHTRLRELVESRTSPEMPKSLPEDTIAEAEIAIVELDGLEGFLKIAKIRGQELLVRDWEYEWVLGAFCNEAIELFGEDRVMQCLAESDDPDVARYHEFWRLEQEKREQKDQYQPGAYRAEMRAIPIEEIFSMARAEEDPPILFRGWGRYADAVDLDAAFEHIWAGSEPRVIAKLLRIFFDAPFQNIDPRWFDLCRHPDHLVRWRAFAVLENHAHPQIREFALAELTTRPFSPAVVGLFIKNYRKGDEAKILESMELPEDDSFLLHSLLLNVVNLLEQNQDVDCLSLALLVYGSTPCERCRRRAVELLIKRGLAPAWMIEECRLDSSYETRNLVEQLDQSASE